MFYRHKSLFENTFVIALLLLPLSMPSFGVSADQNGVLQAQIIEANEKITALASDYQKIAAELGALQTCLNAVHPKTNKLAIKQDQFVGANLAVQRTANGHGR